MSLGFFARKPAMKLCTESANYLLFRKLQLLCLPVIFINFLLFATPWVFAQSPFYPQVVLPEGILRGRKMKSEDEKEFFGFLGVPYAKAPLGPLRFRQPEPHPGWSGLADAWTYKQPCPQWDPRGVDVGSEDCLYLNVYTPSIERKPFNDFLYPVMVFMGSGNFENGDSSIYGPQKLMNKNIVLVTFNHRIGILGFLSTEDQYSSGNYGLYDQLLLLKWVSKNIESFSGDPNSVTLFGQRSGAASIFFHLVSPLSKGLFSKAIMQSGSGLCDWAIQRNPLEYARQISKQLRCPVDSTNDLVDCLRSAPIIDILRVQKDDKLFADHPIQTLPNIETIGVRRFIPQDPWTLLNSGAISRIPVIIGFNTQETCYFYPAIEALNYEDSVLLHEKLVARFLECCSPFKGKIRENVTPIVLFQYFNRFDPSNFSQTVLRFINMTTDSLYTSCVDETVRLLSKGGFSAYLYSFSYQGQNSMIETAISKAMIPFEIGPSNGDELLYLFDMKIGLNRKANFQDQKVSQKLVSLWTDFARLGYTPRMPTQDYPKWDKFDAENLKYLEIGEFLTIKTFDQQSSAMFWSEHLKNVSGIGKGNRKARLRQASGPYRTLAWTMVGVSLSLLILVVFLLSILFYTKKSSSFRATLENGSSHLSSTSSALAISKDPWMCYFSGTGSRQIPDQLPSHRRATISSSMLSTSSRIMNPAIFDTLTNMPPLSKEHLNKMLQEE